MELQLLEEERVVDLASSSIKSIAKRYQIQLRWKSDDLTLPNSKLMAFHRLACLQKKNLRNKQSRFGYFSDIEKMLGKDYAIPVHPK